MSSDEVTKIIHDAAKRGAQKLTADTDDDVPGGGGSDEIDPADLADELGELDPEKLVKFIEKRDKEMLQRLGGMAKRAADPDKGIQPKSESDSGSDAEDDAELSEKERREELIQELTDDCGLVDPAAFLKMLARRNRKIEEQITKANADDDGELESWEREQKETEAIYQRAQESGKRAAKKLGINAG